MAAKNERIQKAKNDLEKTLNNISAARKLRDDLDGEARERMGDVLDVLYARESNIRDAIEDLEVDA